MVEIIKVFKENIPSLRFIGKKYNDFGHWGEWWQNGSNLSGIMAVVI